MTDLKSSNLKTLSLDPRFSYLAKDDRYLFAKDEPRYKFNVIGCGLNGNEHIHVTYLEGRATIQGVFDENPGSIELAQETFARFKSRSRTC